MNSVVLDANIAIYAVLPYPQHRSAIRLLRNLIENKNTIFVPHLWLSEVATSIRKTANLTKISEQYAKTALQAALDLPIKIFSEDSDLCKQAYLWAEKLGQIPVYDSIYLALAERIKASFYTADMKLYKHCLEIGVDFVHILD